jgi:hypothetical protein
MKMNGSAAHPHAANAPAIAIPETLPLPDAAAIRVVDDIGRAAAVITVTGSVIAGPVSVIARAGKRAADDGAADDSAGYRSANTPLRMGGRGHRDGRHGQGGDGSECHQCFLHGVTFLIEHGQLITDLSRRKFHIPLE